MKSLSVEEYLHIISYDSALLQLDEESTIYQEVMNMIDNGYSYLLLRYPDTHARVADILVVAVTDFDEVEAEKWITELGL